MWSRILPVCALALGLGCQGTPVEPAPTREWKLAIEEIAGSVQDVYARRFAESVARRTGGAVQVEVYPYGTLGTSEQLTELTQMGVIELAMASPGHLGTLIPETQVLLLHFLLPDDDELTRAVLGERSLLAAELAPLYREKDLELLSLLVEGWQAWTTKVPVHRLEDLRGVKIRVMTSPLLVAAYEAYGANPVPLPYGEVYGALQLGMIEAQVNPIFAIEEMSFHEVTTAMTLARHAPFVASVVAGRAFFEKLPPKDREILRAASAEAGAAAFEAQRELNARRLERILERKPGYGVIRLSEAERERFREASLPVRRRFVALAGPRGAAILDAVGRAITAAEASGAGRRSRLPPERAPREPSLETVSLLR